jgi:hypothetical protein
MNLAVAAGSEHQAGFGHDDAIGRARRSGAGESARRERRIVAVGNSPLDPRPVQVVLHDRGEWRLDAVAYRVVLVEGRSYWVTPSGYGGAAPRPRPPAALGRFHTEPDPATNRAVLRR